MSSMNSLVDERLLQLKASGAAPVTAIKAIHVEFGLSLVEAKVAFSLSPAWTRDAADGDRLHHEVLTALAKEPRA